jgi:regulatory protein
VCAKNIRRRKQEGEPDEATAFSRLARFCAYQERSHHEVKEKLSELGLFGDTADELLSRLITDGFVNEERFAKAFAGGKFRMKKWGRIRIEHGLQAHRISSRCIEIGLREIDEEDYRKVLQKLIMAKSDAVIAADPYQKWDVVSRYVIAKGYEPELVWETIKLIRD